MSFFKFIIKWNICLLIIQGEEGNSILCKLAEKMCLKIVQDKLLFNNKEHVLIYLRLLKFLGKIDEQIAFLDTEESRGYFRLPFDHDQFMRRVIMEHGDALTNENARKVLKLARKILMERYLLLIYQIDRMIGKLLQI
jgi:hypothetical protein